MITLRSAALAATVIASGAALHSAAAMPVANLASDAGVAKAAFVLDYALSPDRPTRIERIDTETVQTAVADYFDFDAVITLGALALAGGALAGFAAIAGRRSSKAPTPIEPAWRQTVFSAIQADLAAFTETYRRAA